MPVHAAAPIRSTLQHRPHPTKLRFTLPSRKLQSDRLLETATLAMAALAMVTFL
jgi:hypothetical protein